MDCSEFISLASDFRDNRIQGGLKGEIEAHLSSCSSCLKYRAVLDRGTELLRTLPPIEVPDDFVPRLEHRIQHVTDGSSIARETLGSGATSISVLAIAALLALVAWTPRVTFQLPVLDLPAVVVAAPPQASFTPESRRPTFSRGKSFFTTADFQDGIWGDSHQVLFEYSSLYERRRDLVLARLSVE